MPAGMDTASSLAVDIWQLIYGHLSNEDLVRSRLVCKEFDEWLRPLVKELCTRKPIAQSSLELLADSYRNLAVLHISLEYEAEIEPLDWENVNLPNLRDLRMSYCPLHSIVFTEGNTPSLVSLHIKVQEHAVEGFNVSLPELTHMDIQYVEVCDPYGFGPSLSACPKLQYFNSYKLRGLELRDHSTHHLNLPNCASLSLWRADDLNRIEIEAPQLECLNLQACYSLDHVHLAAGPGPQVKVTIVNACIGAASRVHLKEHPRVGHHNLIRQDEFSDPYSDFGGEDDLGDQGFEYFDDFEEADDLDDELDDDVDVPEAFGPHGGLEYDAAHAIWQAMMNAHADS